ncbi:hypothetical protein ABT369_49250 [Dactylosporangium sp. NPDC000244]|uniref:hypothetical protein n=1 Tax=Dactylosporangium sp. NPDC000244 TaxID=3154365 RepID=UPI00332E0F53
MQLRVQFRYRVETGEVEVFQVEDVPDGPRTADHDARHERAARRLAEVVDPHGRVVEELADVEPEPDRTIAAPVEETPAAARQAPLREGGAR